MPRKNCNARPVYRGEELWEIRNSEIKTTPESIVREFRQERAQKTFQPYRINPQAHPHIIRQILYRVNWGRLADYLCLAATVLAVAAITGVIFFGPTSLKEMFR